MSFGVTLSVWLGLTGLGGIAFGAFRQGREVTRLTLARWLFAVGALAPVALLTARLARHAMGVHPGEIAGIGPLAAAAVASLAPFTLAAGFLFAVAVSVVARERGVRSRAIGEVYILEAVGAVLGGVAMSFLLLPSWDPVRIACLTTAVDALGALALTFAFRTSRSALRRSGGFAVAAAVVLGSAIVLAGPAGDALDDWTVRLQWRELGLTSQKNSIYGRIVTAASRAPRASFRCAVASRSLRSRHIPTPAFKAMATKIRAGKIRSRAA